MIDGFTIFHKGGRVLWTKSLAKVLGNPVNQLIKTVLLEERTGHGAFLHDAYRLHWALANEFELVFVVVYQKILQLLYLDDLLQQVKDAFCAMYRSALSTEWGRMTLAAEGFDDVFMKILRQAEDDAERKGRRPDPKGGPSKDQATKEAKTTDTGPTKPEPEVATNGDHTVNSGPPPDREAQLRKILASKGSRNEKGAGGKGAKKKEEERKERSPPAGKREKQMTESWKDKGPEKAAAKVSEDEVRRFTKEFAPRGDVGENYTDDWKVTAGDDEDDDADDDEADTRNEVGALKPAPAPVGKGRLERWLGRIPFTDKVLQDEDLQPLMQAMRSLLVTKNVASNIADQLCASVADTLKGTTVGKFSRTSTAVRQAMEAALTRILTPKREVNILRDVARVRAEGRPYVVVFCGVNGVGKSTSLAKICYWLTHNNLKVLIAACDTFRSGAVEQLRIHSQCLGTPLYERGYGKDAAAIAADAISQAAKEGRDVVLVDTAGRMQDNEPLMRSLTNLINVNKPDLILFVGEALVGNDGVDQVMKFNAAMRDLSSQSVPRLIDGIVLTKFDTIDDKVGASISMVYATGQPIVFVGVGQTYTDLKKLNASVVVDLLLK